IEADAEIRRKEAADWFARLNQRKVTTADVRRFSAWRRDPENARAFARLEALWSATVPLGRSPDIQILTEAAARPRRSRPSRNPLRDRLVPIGAVGALALALGAAASLLYTLGAAVLIGRHVMLPLRRASPNTVIVASLGVLVVLEEMVRIAMESRSLWLSPFLNREVVFWADGGFKVTLTVIQLTNAAAMVSLVAAGHLLLTRTRLGRAWRGVADDPLAAEMCGTDARAVFVWSYVVSAAIAAVCGVLATSYYGTMDFGAGLMFGLKVVLVAAAGGYSVPLRSALGAAAVALAETLWSGYGPILWRDLVIVGGLVTVLVISRQERAIP
ncbi:DUF4880 domain-containing protein, partial [Brevundimonas sp.]|uniref:ABC transporter permease subunit n=1 Tax=Brevundimonas sp. TaxID=1871086 RepID=UPI0019CEF27D